MMMFEQQLDEITDIPVFKTGYNNILKWKNKDKNKKWTETELEFLKRLKKHILMMNEIYDKDFNKYTRN